MKIPYPIIPIHTVELPYGETAEVYSDDILNIEIVSEKNSSTSYDQISMYYNVSFSEPYAPTDSDKVYVISNATNNKLCVYVKNDDGVYSFTACYNSFINNSVQNYSTSESYTLKWVHGEKIYSISIALQSDIWDVESDKITIKAYCTGHINGIATVGENPFEEGVE